MSASPAVARGRGSAPPENLKRWVRHHPRPRVLRANLKLQGKGAGRAHGRCEHNPCSACSFASFGAKPRPGLPGGSRPYGEKGGPVFDAGLRPAVVGEHTAGLVTLGDSSRPRLRQADAFGRGGRRCENVGRMGGFEGCLVKVGLSEAEGSPRGAGSCCRTPGSTGSALWPRLARPAARRARRSACLVTGPSAPGPGGRQGAVC